MAQLIYCYDSYCGWCYGFAPVMRQLSEKYKRVLNIEVLSGGMIVTNPPKHISASATYIESSYKQIEDYTGVKFGSDYLWHIKNPEESDWYPDSVKPAIALCIFKESYPSLQVEFATALEHALFAEGRDLCDNEAYRHLLELFNIPADDFYTKLSSTEYKEKALYEFALVKQLQVTGFPVLFLQESDTKFHMLAKGFTDFDTVDDRLSKTLQATK